MTGSRVGKLLGVIRAPFLLLVPAVLAPALAVALRAGGTVDPLDAGLVLVAALAAHIAVNALNEYQDFRSGLDFHTRRTPFSGGSGTLVGDGDFAPVALHTGVVALAVVVVAGLYFLWQKGPAIVVPGLLGVALIVGYTPWLNRFPLLCLLAPGAGFGLLMVNLAVLVTVGRTPPAALALSVMVTCLVSNLLLINQLPDVEADRRAGRHHAAIAWGPEWVPRLYLGLLTLAAVTPIWAWRAGWFPVATLVAAAALVPGLWVARRLWRYAAGEPVSPVPALALNTLMTLTVPPVLAWGLWSG